MPQLIPHTLDDVADGAEGILGVPFGSRCQPIGLEQSSLFSRSGIADAKKNPSAETVERGGTSALGGRGVSVLEHFGTPSQHPRGSGL